MAEMIELIKLVKLQMEQMERQHKEEMNTLKAMLLTENKGVATVVTTATPSFAPFHSTSELRRDCWSRFCTFATANSVPEERRVQVFLTN